MIVELLYTSAPQGLKQGSRGFCTVLCTTGLPINLAQRLEALSAYRHLYQPGDARADANPVCYSHVRFSVGGRTVSVVSRIAAYGLDYSQRTNKLAHHLVFDNELPRCGPGAVLAQPIMRTQWDGQCATLPSGPKVNDAPEAAAACQAWQRLTGDAGWAGVVANAWMKESPKPTWIIFSEAQSSQLIGLMREAVALLPEKMRWKATFSTYCTNLPPDVDCKVRCVVAGSDEARMSIARGDVIDLTKKLASPPDSPAVAAARLGKSIGDAQKGPPPKAEPIRPVPASVTNTTASFDPSDDVGQLESVQEYELQAEEFVRPAPSPKKLPPRPLVQPKHLKVPKPVGNKAGAISPIWFVGGVGALVLVLLLAVTVVMLSRPKTPGETAMNDTDVSGQNGPEAGGGQDATPSTNDFQSSTFTDRDAPPTVPQETVATSLVCNPTEITVFLKDLQSTLLTQLKLEGSPGQSLDPQKVKVLRDGQEFSSILIESDGRVKWKVDNKPELSTEEAVYNFEIAYDVGNLRSLKANFKLTVRAGETPDLSFRIVSQPEMQEPFALGAKLSPKFTVNTDETDNGQNRKWTWERSDQRDAAEEKWHEVNHEEIYSITLEDLGKYLRLTRNKRGTNEVHSVPVEILAPNVVTISIEQLLASSPFDERGKVKVSRPNVKEKQVLSYGISNVKIEADHTLSIPLGKLLTDSDKKTFEQKFDALRLANLKYLNLLAVLQKPSSNHVRQVLRNELFLDRKNFTLDAKCEFASQRRKLDSFVGKLVRLGEIYRTTDKKLVDEEQQLRESFISSSTGYPHEDDIRPMDDRTPQEREAAIREFLSTGGVKFWQELTSAEQAFFAEVSTAGKQSLPMFIAADKISVKEKVEAPNGTSSIVNATRTLFQYPMALKFSIDVPPVASKLLAAIENKPPEAASASKAGPASVGTEDVTK